MLKGEFATAVVRQQLLLLCLTDMDSMGWGSTGLCDSPPKFASNYYLNSVHIYISLGYWVVPDSANVLIELDWATIESQLNHTYLFCCLLVLLLLIESVSLIQA